MRKSLRRKLVSLLICVSLVATIIILVLPQAQAQEEEEEEGIEVEVQTGPTFKDEDAGTAESCTSNILADKFPFDFVKGNIGSGSECPNIEFFGYRHEFCWVVEIWLSIEPAFITSLMVYGIFNW